MQASWWYVSPVGAWALTGDIVHMHVDDNDDDDCPVMCVAVDRALLAVCVLGRAHVCVY